MKVLVFVDFVSEEIPKEILEAARVIGEWATKNRHNYWAIGNFCDRKYETIVRAILARRRLRY